LTRRLGEVRAGTFVHPKDLEDERGPTFDEFVDRFMRVYAVRCRSDHYKDRVKRLRPCLGGHRLRQISLADLDLFISKRRSEVGSSTLRKDIAALGTIFKKAVEWGVIEASPAVGLRKPKEERPRTRYLTVREWGSLEGTLPPWLKPMVTLALATGMRLKEVSKLRWDDVDRGPDVIHVPMDTKTGTRPIPINRMAQKALAGQVRHLRNPYVFVDSQGEHFDSDLRRNRISRCTTQAMRAAGISNASFHTLRHTAASLMVQGGVPLYEVQKILGHSTPLMTERYAHLQPGHLVGAVDVLDRAFEMDTQMDTCAAPHTSVQTPPSANSLIKQ